MTTPDGAWAAYAAGHASVYDDLYAGRGKDYAAESVTIAEEILARKHDATSLLDVGCGTGAHLAILRERFAYVEGVEPSAAMRAHAKDRLDGVTIHDGEMTTFATGRTYSAVICMFSTIGYAGGASGSVDGLHRAIGNMASHLDPGGVLVIEPWLFPDRYEVGHIGNDFTHTERREIVRMSHSGLAGTNDRVSVLTMHYLVGEANGVAHFADVHLLSMFTRAEFIAALTAAGCDVDYLEPGLGRGLFVGSRRR